MTRLDSYPCALSTSSACHHKCLEHISQKGLPATPGHGGLKVTGGAARRFLTAQARAIGDKWSGAYWYEEDVTYTVPFYENPKWGAILTRLAGISHRSNSVRSRIYLHL